MSSTLTLLLLSFRIFLDRLGFLAVKSIEVLVVHFLDVVDVVTTAADGLEGEEDNRFPASYVANRAVILWLSLSRIGSGE